MSIDRAHLPQGPTRADLLAKGYTKHKHTTCTRCQKPVEAWLSHPNKRSVLYDLMSTDDTRAVCHWEHCKPGSKPSAPPTGSAPAAGTPADDVFVALQRLGARHKAQAVVLVFESGAYEAVWHNAANAEDVKHNLITAANDMRRRMGARA